MGCGWQAEIDWSKVHAIEVLNGGAMAAFGGRAESPLSGVGFWEGLLDQGHRLTAIGGSDSHDPDRPVEAPGALGRPATVIHAASLSQSDLMAGLRAGRVFIDLGHPGLKRLDLEAAAAGRTALMGGARSEEHTSELQSRRNLVCRRLLEKKNTTAYTSAARAE